jgi:hypothetical protein
LKREIKIAWTSVDPENGVKHTIRFAPSGRGKAQCPPDPEYPNGVALDVSDSAKLSCNVALPYPAPECGYWHIACDVCELSVAITAAGRPDDPVSARVPCAKNKLAI